VGGEREEREGPRGTSCTCLIPDLMSRAEIEILRSVGRRPSQAETFPLQNVGMEFDLHGFLATALYLRKQYRYASLNDGHTF